MVKVCIDLDGGGSAEQSDQLNLASGGELTISSGAVTITKSLHTIDTEGDAVSDDLTTINGGSVGDVILLSRANAARAVILKHNDGNIKTPSGTDHELTALGFVILEFDGSNWYLQSGNGSGYILNKLACLTVATENIALFDEQVINGVICGNNARVFLAGQTDPKENGPWIVKAADLYYDPGAWVRPEDFQDGFSVSGHLFYIEQGTEHSDSMWIITNHYGEDIVGTDDLNAINLSDGSSFDIVSLPEDSTNTSDDYLAKYDGANNKIKRNDLLNPGIKILTDAATITIDLSEPERTFSVVLGGNRTLEVVNAIPGEEFWVKLIQDGTGNRTVTWFETLNWSGGSAPTLTPTANKADYFQFKVPSVNTYDCRHSILNLDTDTGDIDVTTGLVSHWKLDEASGDRADSVGSHDMVVTGGNTAINTDVGPGIQGQAIGLPYLDSYLSTANHADFNPTTTSFSVAIWFQPHSIYENSFANLIGKGDSVWPTGQFHLTHEGEFIKFRVATDQDTWAEWADNPPTNGIDLYPAPINDTDWHLLVAVVDWPNKKLKLSLDGSTFILRTLIGTELQSVTAPLHIGITKVSGTPTYRYDGALDEASYWNIALSEQQKNYLWNNGIGHSYPFNI